jgi:hypothetical protein
MHKMITRIAAAMATTPPTTPPAIAPTGVFLCPGEAVEVTVGEVEVVVGEVVEGDDVPGGLEELVVKTQVTYTGKSAVRSPTVREYRNESVV